MHSRNLLASSFGNILEWFDFALFIFLAPVIGENFFPSHDMHSATLAALGVFAAGFIARPIGGILFGHIGDRNGRSKTLLYSILLVTLATFFTGFLPTYANIGILAPILFTGFRILQGLSVGGEYSGIMVYLAESAPNHRRGFITSFAATGANIGFLLATVVVMLLKFLLPLSAILAWAWRLPFIIIGALGLIIFYFRLKLIETPAYLHLKKTRRIEKQPLLSALRSAPGALLKILGITCVSSTFYYVFFGYMPQYLNQNLNISSSLAFALQSLALLLMLFLVPLAAICGDRFGRKKMLIISTLCILTLTLPSFYLLNTRAISAIALALSIATIICSIDQGNSLTAVVENCPLNVRYSGVSFSYNLGNALFGGTAPLIVNLLTTHMSNIAPAYYLMGMGVVSLIAILTLANANKINFLATISQSKEEPIINS